MSFEFNSYIFKPSKQLEMLHERKELITWIILLSAILLLLLDFAIIPLITIILIVIVNLWTIASGWNRNEKLRGSLETKLRITDSNISFGDESYSFSEIQITKLICYDYKGRQSQDYAFFTSYPVKSHGAWNHLWFIYKGTEYKLRFAINTKKESEDLEQLKLRLGIG